MIDFTGRTAIVTGAAKGIGLAVAMRLAQGHAKVALVDINEQNLAEAKAKIDAFGIPALTYVCDPDCAPCDMNFIGRNGSPDECAAVICFLASEDASYITGQNILVDGLRRITL